MPYLNIPVFRVKIEYFGLGLQVVGPTNICSSVMLISESIIIILVVLYSQLEDIIAIIPDEKKHNVKKSKNDNPNLVCAVLTWHLSNETLNAL